MRVISGEFRGRRLKSLSGRNTRPTTDKVKEAIFNMVGPNFSGGFVLDLFAGSGALGIEAISRGMERAFLVDSYLPALEKAKENIDLIKASKRFKLYQRRANTVLPLLARQSLKFDLIFLDPPYANQEIEEQLIEMQKLDLLVPFAKIVAEVDAKVDLPEEIGDLTLIQRRKYGITMIFIYHKKGV